MVFNILDIVYPDFLKRQKGNTFIRIQIYNIHLVNTDLKKNGILLNDKVRVVANTILKNGRTFE